MALPYRPWISTTRRCLSSSPAKAVNLPLQAGDLPIAGVGPLVAGRTPERLIRALVALLAPSADQ